MRAISRVAGGSRGHRRSRVMTFAVFMLLCGAIGQVAGDDEAVDSIDPDSDDSFPTSEDVPLWQFEATVVTIGKASGKEKKKEVPAFFLRGDDAPQAATRFVYLNSLPMNHLPHFTSVFSHEWTHNVPDDVKPRERAHKRRAKALGPKSYWKRGVEHAENGRDGEAHFDYARAVVGAGLDTIEDQQTKAEETMSSDDVDKVYELLNAHHRRHSRALNAAEKTREQRAAAHERDAWVFERRKEARRRSIEDEDDFRAAFGVEGPDATSSNDATSSEHQKAPESPETPRVSIVTGGLAVSMLNADDAASAVAGHFADIGNTDAKRACAAALELHGKSSRPVLKCGDSDSATDPDPPTAEACGNAAKAALDGSEDDGTLAATYLLRAFVTVGGKVSDDNFYADLTKALTMKHAYDSMRAAVQAEDWDAVVAHGAKGDGAIARRKPDATRKLAVARAHKELGTGASASARLTPPSPRGKPAATGAAGRCARSPSLTARSVPSREATGTPRFACTRSRCGPTPTPPSSKLPTSS